MLVETGADLDAVAGRNGSESEHCAVGVCAGRQAVEVEREPPQSWCAAGSGSGWLGQRQCPVWRRPLDEKIDRLPLRRGDLHHDAFAPAAFLATHRANGESCAGAERYTPRNACLSREER